MCKIINIENLITCDFHINNVTAHFHYWQHNAKWDSPITGRESNCLMFFINCKNTYSTNNQKVAVANPNDIAYIPANEIYSCLFEHIDSNNSNNNIPKNKKTENFYFNGKHTYFKNMIYNAVFVSFDIFDENHNPIKLANGIKIFQYSDTKKIKSKFEEIAFLANNGIASPLKMNIALYQIILELAKNIQKSYAFSKKSLEIQPALNYISSHNLNEITIPALANVCNMSVSGFREKFKNELGISPIKYIAELKIQKAQNMLMKENMSVSSIALNLGFSDVGYFSKFYKKHTGRNPSERY